MNKNYSRRVRVSSRDIPSERWGWGWGWGWGTFIIPRAPKGPNPALDLRLRSRTCARSQLFLHFLCCQRDKYIIYFRFKNRKQERIDGVMVSVLASSPVDRGFDSRSGQTKNYNIAICCFIKEKEQGLIGSESE